ncbi:MAG: type IV secretion system protein (plasmid) [Candidatus Symbiodolus clandestinus]
MTTVFQGIAGSVNNALKTFITDSSSSLIQEITPWAISGTTIYLMLYGYMILYGKIQQPINDFFIKSAKILLIGLVALNTDVYLEWVVNFFQGVEESLAKALSHSSGTDSSVYASLDHSLSKGFEVVLQCREKATGAGWSKFSLALCWWIITGLIGTGFFLVSLTGGVAVLMSTIMLKLAFSIGPIFVLCAMWPVTAKFFDSWVSFLFNHILIVVLTIVVLSFSITIFNNELQKINFDSQQNMLLVALELLVVSGILYAVVRGILPMAAALAGGFTMAVMGISHLAQYGTLSLRATKGAGSGIAAAGKGLYGASQWAYSKMANRNTVTNASSGGGQSTPAYMRASMDHLKKSGVLGSNGKVEMPDLEESGGKTS